MGLIPYPGIIGDEGMGQPTGLGAAPEPEGFPSHHSSHQEYKSQIILADLGWHGHSPRCPVPVGCARISWILPKRDFKKALGRLDSSDIFYVIPKHSYDWEDKVWKG